MTLDHLPGQVGRGLDIIAAVTALIAYFGQHLPETALILTIIYTALRICADPTVRAIAKFFAGLPALVRAGLRRLHGKETKDVDL